MIVVVAVAVVVAVVVVAAAAVVAVVAVAVAAAAAAFAPLFMHESDVYDGAQVAQEERDSPNCFEAVAHLLQQNCATATASALDANRNSPVRNSDALVATHVFVLLLLML